MPVRQFKTAGFLDHAEIASGLEENGIDEYTITSSGCFVVVRWPAVTARTHQFQENAHAGVEHAMASATAAHVDWRQHKQVTAPLVMGVACG